MITLRSLIEAELRQQPDILYWLEKDLINVTSLARYLRPSIEKQRGEKVGLETISMAIRRLQLDGLTASGAKIHVPVAKNLQVQLDITLLTFQRGVTLPDLRGSSNFRFFSLAQGSHQSMLAISSENCKESWVGNKKIQEKMAAITVTLSGESSDTVGAYAYILLILALAGVPVAEVVTLHDDLTLVIADENTDKAFQTLRKALLQ